MPYQLILGPDISTSDGYHSLWRRTGSHCELEFMEFHPEIVEYFKKRKVKINYQINTIMVDGTLKPRISLFFTSMESMLEFQLNFS